MTNPFSVGQLVECINDDFMCIDTKAPAAFGSTPLICPVKGERLIVDRIAGEYLGFEPYDEPGEENYWAWNMFRAVDLDIEMVDGEIENVKAVFFDAAIV